MERPNTASKERVEGRVKGRVLSNMERTKFLGIRCPYDPELPSCGYNRIRTKLATTGSDRLENVLQATKGLLVRASQTNNVDLLEGTSEMIHAASG
jgi:hypothetical protein